MQAAGGYASRTMTNASQADLTVAFALNFLTAGERLTHRASKPDYLAIDVRQSVELSERQLRHRLSLPASSGRAVRTLNVAGNSIATFDLLGWTQERVDRYIGHVLYLVHAQRPIQHIRSGGQTGADMAGLVAAVALGIEATGYFPKGYLQRGTDRQDISRDPRVLREEIEQRAALLRQELATLSGDLAPGLDGAAASSSSSLTL